MTGFAGVFELTAQGDEIFEGAPAIEGGLRVYGGHTLTQGLLACFETAPAGWDCYGLQSQFMRMANPSLPITYSVERTSGSRNFAVRRVRADQAGRAVMTMTASFQMPYAGHEFQSATMPDAPSPEFFRSEVERYQEIIDSMAPGAHEVQHLPSGIDARWTDPQSLDTPVVKSPHNMTWLRITEEVGRTPKYRQLALAFCSDFAFLETALRPRGYSWVNPANLVAGTLDHAIWFHRPTDITRWHLCASSCTSIHAGRGFVRGELFDATGVLVASIAQEGILRLA